MPKSEVIPGHRDYPVLHRTAETIQQRAGGLYRLRERFPLLIRQAVDEVVDTQRSGRFRIEELEKTEKTYIGTKIEILLRNFLQFQKGKLDLNIDGLDVDIKNTVGSTWMIPSEAISKPCLLVAFDEEKYQAFLGLFVAHLEFLTLGKNRDAKRSVSAEGFRNIYWIIRELPCPKPLLAQLDRKTAAYITDLQDTGGTERIRRLFTSIQRTPISRSVVADVAKQSDYMKRLRWNGGARDELWKESIVLLSGKYHKTLIAALGLPSCADDEFVSMKLETNDQHQIVNASDYLP